MECAYPPAGIIVMAFASRLLNAGYRHKYVVFRMVMRREYRGTPEFPPDYKKINIGDTLHSRGDEILFRPARRSPEELKPDGNRARSWRKILFCGLLIAFVIVTVCTPVLAQTGIGEFSTGIPVLWPYHAILMVTGFLLLAAGFITAHFHATKNWFRTHKILQISGATCILAGIFIGAYMVALSGFPHLSNLHEIAGLVIGILLPVMILLGFSIFRVKKSMNTVRASHRWLGRVVIALILANIILGIITLRLVLGL
jgi:hypothetical protein